MERLVGVDGEDEQQAAAIPHDMLACAVQGGSDAAAGVEGGEDKDERDRSPDKRLVRAVFRDVFSAFFSSWPFSTY